MVDALILIFALLSLVALVAAADTLTTLAVPGLRGKAVRHLGDFALPTAAATAAVPRWVPCSCRTFPKGRTNDVAGDTPPPPRRSGGTRRPR